MKTVAILCARADSHYKTLPGLDVFDAKRDARTFRGGMPVFAHPPCRLWGRLKALARSADADAERALGVWCANQVRECGGVLEHPIDSTLWKTAGLPLPGERDKLGGFTVAAAQWWWGHRAEKWTWFYVAGLDPRDLPEIPYRIGRAERVITNVRGLRAGMPGFRTECTKAEREHTPPALAAWLVETARRSASRCAAAV